MIQPDLPERGPSNVIDNIWSGWRSRYVSSLDRRIDRSESVGPSVFKQILDSDLDDEAAFIVHRRTKVFTIMNSHPYSVGHVLVLPYRQVSELEDLDSEEMSELWTEVREAVSVLRTVLDPDGFNVGLNLGAAAGGSVSEHLHVHVVPRWFGDANFTVATASVKAIPQALDVTAGNLRKTWSSRDSRRESER